MQLSEWITSKGGIVHRRVAHDAQWSPRAVRAEVGRGAVEVVRRTWLVTPQAPADELAAARAGARVACVSLAKARRWWMPDDVDRRLHLSRAPHARAVEHGADEVIHWSKPVAPASAFDLHESIEDALAHIAVCVAPEPARVLWESAIRIERLSIEALRRVRWTTRAAARLAGEVSALSDSGLESIFLIRLGPWGLPIRQQAVVAGRAVDFLIGDLLIVQIDGHAHHSSAADRGRDVAHDAELRLRGYTVLRFTYAQVLHDWRGVERTIARAVAAGLHTAPGRRAG